MLDVRDLVVAYGAIEALHGISFTVDEGEIVTLIGANGAGKTTALHAISRLVEAKGGTIRFEGHAIERASPTSVVQLGISQVPEGRRLFQEMSVLENLQMGAYLRPAGAKVRADIEQTFEYFPILRERAMARAGTLSGGEQQMLAIGRGLMARPRLLLLDEPSLGLAPKLVELIFGIIQQINAHGTTILLVEQNARMALSIANRGYVLASGTVHLSDTGEALLRNDDVRRTYLGESGS